MLVAYASDEPIMVQQRLSFKIECSDQGLAESQSRTFDRRGDPHRASAGPLQLVSATFHFFHRRLSASIQLNQLFRQRQVCLKGIHRDQHRSVPESASHNRQLMLTSNTLCWCRRSHISPCCFAAQQTHGDYCALITFSAMTRHSTYSPSLCS